MPKLHFDAPAAACTHSFALSSSYCIWLRLCALLAQLVHHSRMTKMAHIRTVWGNLARRRFLPYKTSINSDLSTDSGQPWGAWNERISRAPFLQVISWKICSTVLCYIALYTKKRYKPTPTATLPTWKLPTFCRNEPMTPKLPFNVSNLLR